MTNDYNNNDNKKTGQSQSTLKRKPGRPQGYKLSYASIEKMLESRRARKRPQGPRPKNIELDKNKSASVDPRIKTQYIKYTRVGWLVNAYKCNLCDDYTNSLESNCLLHVEHCSGLNRQQQRNTKKLPTEQLIIRLASGEVVTREEMK